MNTGYEIREAREEDRDSVVQVLSRALGPLESFTEEWVESWRRYWFRPEHEDWAYVATYKGRVVANISFFANDFNTIRGNRLRFGGVWAVGTEYEHRRKGLLKGLFDKAFPRMKEEGIVLSILDPSPYEGAQIAYEKCGYAIAESRVDHEFSPDALRQTEGQKNITVRELKDTNEARKISELEVTMGRYGSRVFNFFLTTYIQEIRSGHFYILEQDFKPVGCVKLSSRESSNGSVLKVSRTYFKSGNVLPSIIALIAQNSNEVVKIEWDCEPQIPLRDYIQNIHKIKTQYTGTMMMRVVDFEKYLASIQVPEHAEGNLVVALHDIQCPWNEGSYRLDFSQGVLDIDRIDGNSNAHITLNPFQLSRVIGGLTFPSVLQQLGIVMCSPETAKNLDALFPADCFVSYCRF